MSAFFVGHPVAILTWFEYLKYRTLPQFAETLSYKPK